MTICSHQFFSHVRDNFLSSWQEGDTSESRTSNPGKKWIKCLALGDNTVTSESRTSIPLIPALNKIHIFDKNCSFKNDFK